MSTRKTNGSMKNINAEDKIRQAEIIMNEKEDILLANIEEIVEKGHKNKKIDRECGWITDGITCKQGYLRAETKVAWVLKEPYDEFDAAGNPCGGFSSLTQEYFKAPDNWKKIIWQKVAYTMYGFHYQKTWEEMPSINEKHSIIEEIFNVAWINISKIPGRTRSDDSKIANAYNTLWRDIVLGQLELYNPDVIIFGKTFHCFINDPDGNKYQNAQKDNMISAELSKNTKYPVEYFRLGRKRLISAYHPGRKGGDYVQSLIDALNLAQKEIVKE